MPRRNIQQGQSCVPQGFAQWGLADRPAHSLAGIAYGGRRVRRQFGVIRVPYFALWLPSWQFEYDVVFGGYLWQRAVLLWRKGLGLRIFYAPHPHESWRMVVTDRELANRPR